MALRIDFGSSYNDAQKRKANEIYEKIENTFAKFHLSDEDFFEYMKTNIDGYYFSTANFERIAEDRNNGDKLIRNIFLRPRIDSEFSQLLNGNGFILIGDVFINPREDRSFFSVNDFYLCENTDMMSYEVFAYAPLNMKTLYDEWDYRQGNTILNLDFIESLPYIISPTKFNTFIKKWENYLDFEYELTKMGITYKAIKDLRFDVLYEVNSNEINKETFKDDILVEFDKKLYVKESSQYLTGEENQYVFASVELDKTKELKSFFYQSLSLVAKRRTNQLDRLIRGEDVEDIVQVPLGEFLLSEDTNYNTTIAYFYVPDAIDDDGNADLASFKEANKSTLDDSPVLASTAIGDIALYRRGKAAIDNMKKGRVKNPFLVGLLIDPSNFESHVDLYTKDNVKFALDKKLNESQKEAILRALNSNSIFALQGPPGTGKTQTITELVYQYNKMGKKVLLSSQTHIAIDNVIERLPHEMNILPIRLVKDLKRANKQYLPDKLLDNLYESAYYKFSEKIEMYNNFSKEIDTINTEFENNMELYSNIKTRQKKCDSINSEISKLRKESQQYVDQLIDLERQEKKIQSNKKFLLEYYNNELDFNKITDEIDNERYYSMLENLFKELSFDEEESVADYISMLKRRIGNDRIKLLNDLSIGKAGKSKEYIEIQKQIEEQKNAIKALEAMNNPSLQSAIDTTRKNINSLLGKLKTLDEDDDSNNKIIDISNTTFYFVKDKSNPQLAISEELRHINEANQLYKKHVKNLMSSKFIKELESDNIDKAKENVEKDYKVTDIKLKNLEKDLNENLEPIKKQREHLTEYFNSFFMEKLNNNSLPESDDDKFMKIQDYINEKQEEFNAFKEDYKLYHQIYEDSVALLNDRKNILGRQRIQFTKDLFINNANVYGITCTSSATFKSDKNDYLKALEIGDVDVSRQDFDVVIIDEVSKANPIEIMIPLLYGKSVVLVGDQRQLPPIFKYRESMFKDFSDEQKAKLFKNFTLDQFKEQVESSLFEEIYNLLKYNKAMLTQQYRFNSQIMKCVNVFYNDKLQAGWGSAQDNKKQHYLKVDYNRNGKNVVVFDPKYSTYWFNTHKYSDDVVAYEKSKDGKTSLFNELEGKVTYELLKLLDSGYGELKRNAPATYEKAVESTESDKPSVAVISMYGAQIGYIINLIKTDKYKFANIDVDISTVDNYQGKEKDIIIVNFVRNNKRGDAGEFIKKFNRINVAISRARNMLLVVGSKEFCSNLTVNVPEMGSSKENLIHAYGEIYDRCEIRFNHIAGLFDIKLRK